VLVAALFVQDTTVRSAEYSVTQAGTAQCGKPVTTVCGVGIEPQRLIRCVGAVIHDHAGRLLLVRRATEPGRGRWSLPGGRVEPGESDAAALRREVNEETGLVVNVGPLLGSVRRPSPDGRLFDIFDYQCTAVATMLRPGDDASDARWVSAADYPALPLVDGLTEALSEWSALPR
jgi:8-oxo-dGTP diphosphatase